MVKRIIWLFILVSFFSIYVMPERGLAANSSDSSSSGAVTGAIIGAIIGTVLVVIMAVASHNSRAKDPEEKDNSRESISPSSALNFGIPSQKYFTSSEQDINNGYVIAIRF